MKYLLILTVIFTMLLVNCKMKSEFVKISKRIQQATDKRSGYTMTKRRTLFYKARTAVYRKVNFLANLSKSDTLYVIESYNAESFLVRGTIWDKQNSVSYTYRKLVDGDELNILKSAPFTKRQLSFIRNWDVEKIKAEETSKNNLRSQIKLIASRCYFLDERLKINQLVFQDFFDPKLDDLR